MASIRPVLAVLLSTAPASMLVGACAGAGAASDGGSGRSPPGCLYSTAKTDSDSCQVNFFCDGGELAVYCLGNSDGGSSCTCHQGANKTPLDRPGLCDLSHEDRVQAVRNVCGWSL